MGTREGDRVGGVGVKELFETRSGKGIECDDWNAVLMYFRKGCTRHKCFRYLSGREITA